MSTSTPSALDEHREHRAEPAGATNRDGLPARAYYVDQADYECVQIVGADRVRFVNGMCTANIETLPTAGVRRAAMLSVKGRVVSMFEVVNTSDALLLVCEPGVANATLELLARYAIMDDVTMTRADRPIYRTWMTVDDVWEAPPQFGVCPQPVMSPSLVEAIRVAAGMPRFGIDVSDQDFPFESRLRETIDYEKGCFIGQEPVARVAAKGRPNRDLVVLRLGTGALPARGARVSHPNKSNAGSVTSAAQHPTLGALALAYVHRSVAEPGTVVLLDDREVTVAQPPVRAT